jgi:sugar-specific transcriptional regulator TrmB
MESNIQIIALLNALGLSESETKTYLTLLELGSSKTGEIIHNSGLYSSIVYANLEKLMKRGLVHYTLVGKRKYFAAENPSKLVEIAKDLERRAREAIPILDKMQNSQKPEQKQDVFVYQGYSGVEKVFNNILNSLKKGDEELVLGVSNIELPMRQFFKKWNRARERQMVRQRMVLFADAIEFIKTYEKQKLTKLRILPNKEETPLVISVYSDKTVITLWGNSPTAILIDNERMTDGFKRYFNRVWNSAEKLKE